MDTDSKSSISDSGAFDVEATKQAFISTLVNASQIAVEMIGKEGQFGRDNPYYFFVKHASAINNYISQNRYTSRLYCCSERELTALLPIHLLSSESVILQFDPYFEDISGKRPPFFRETKWEVWNRIKDGQANPNVGRIWIDYGPAEIFQTLINSGKSFFDSGYLNMLPTMRCDIDSGFAEEREAAKTYSIGVKLKGVRVDHERDVEALLTDVVLPIIAPVKASDLLHLIADEWDAFESCRRHFLETQSRLLNIPDKHEARAEAERLKCEILDQGINELSERYTKLQRKGLINSLGGSIVGVTFCMTCLASTEVSQILLNLLGGGVSKFMTLYNYFDYRSGLKSLTESPYYFLTKLPLDQ